MAAENDITSMHEAVDIFTATNLLNCPEFKSCLETIEHKYPQLSADDVVNMLTRITLKENPTHAIDGICVVPWFETRLNEYLQYCGFQQSDMGSDVVDGENSNSDVDDVDITDEAASCRRFHSIGERISAPVDLNNPERIAKLREREEKKREEEMEKEKKKAARDAKRKEREVKEREKEAQKQAQIEAQSELVAFLMTKGFIADNFESSKFIVPKKLVIKFISTNKMGGNKWKEWLVSNGRQPINLNSKDTTTELMWEYIKSVV